MQPLTPGARARLDSCMRTLMVSAEPSENGNTTDNILYLQLKDHAYLADGRRGPPSYPRRRRLCLLSVHTQSQDSHTLVDALGQLTY